MKMLSWYFYRLRSMNIREVGYRVLRWTQSMRIRYRSPEREALKIMGDLREENFQDYINGLDAVYYFNSEDRAEILDFLNRQSTRDYSSFMETADRTLDHRVKLLGREIRLGKNINWNLDPITGIDWSSRNTTHIALRNDSRSADIRWIWELNRHHHLVTLGKAYYLSEDNKYTIELIDQISAWIDYCIPWKGVQWNSALEVAIRIINWIWALEFIRGSNVLSAATFRTVVASISQQTNYIYNNLSRYSSANNHIIGEAACLAIVGIRFPWLPNAGTWREDGLQILEDELETQILPDGVPAEQSIHYLEFILELNLLAWRLAEINGYRVPELWYERLASSSNFLTHLMDDRHFIPDIGDSDDGCVLRFLETEEFSNIRSILGSAAVLLQRSDLKAKAGNWNEKNEWILGRWGRERFNALEARKPSMKSKLFPIGGYAVMRDEISILTFDFGALGYLSTAAHGHADALSIMISSKGTPLLIDPGTYAYNDGELWRNYFRGTKAHNTVVVNDNNQSEIIGNFLWKNKAKAHFLFWETNPACDLIVARHDGYSRQGILHTRCLVFKKPGFLLVSDTIAGTGTQRIEQLWHFPHEAVVEQSRDTFSVRVNGLQMLLQEPGHPNMTARILRGIDRPIQGWVSPSYGSKKPAPVLSIIGDLTLPTELITYMDFRKDPVLSTQDRSEIYSILIRKRAELDI